MNSRFVARAAIYAALYAALTLAPGLNALAYGQVQFRLSEALLVFACVDPAAVVGLAVGTALGNVNSSLGPADVLFGALLTLVAALAMYRIGLHWWALAVPVVVNGLGVAAELVQASPLPPAVAAHRPHSPPALHTQHPRTPPAHPPASTPAFVARDRHRHLVGRRRPRPGHGHRAVRRRRVSRQRERPVILPRWAAQDRRCGAHGEVCGAEMGGRRRPGRVAPATPRCVPETGQEARRVGARPCRPPHHHPEPPDLCLSLVAQKLARGRAAPARPAARAVTRPSTPPRVGTHCAPQPPTPTPLSRPPRSWGPPRPRRRRAGAHPRRRAHRLRPRRSWPRWASTCPPAP